MNSTLKLKALKLSSLYVQFFIMCLIMLLFSQTTYGSERVLGNWSLDKDFVARASLERGILSIRLINNGANPRIINAALTDERYLMANVVRIRIRSTEDPRGKLQMFRIFGDGVIGISSEIFPVTQLEIKAGDSIETKVAFSSALEELFVANQTLANWNREGHNPVCITLAIAFRDIGIISDAGVELTSPWLIVDLPSKK